MSYIGSMNLVHPPSFFPAAIVALLLASCTPGVKNVAPPSNWSKSSVTSGYVVKKLRTVSPKDEVVIEKLVPDIHSIKKSHSRLRNYEQVILADGARLTILYRDSIHCVTTDAIDEILEGRPPDRSRRSTKISLSVKSVHLYRETGELLIERSFN